MCAVQTSLTADDLPDSLAPIRKAIEAAVPVGFDLHKTAPQESYDAWADLYKGFRSIVDRFPVLDRGSEIESLGTLGGGNHFIEMCLGEQLHQFHHLIL